jgi:hypothetical protein
MIRLRGATQVTPLVLKRWGSSTIFDRAEVCEHSNSRYVKRFACPDCGGEAFELFRQLDASSETPEWWEVDWTSACGYIFDSLSSDSIHSRFIEVDENGVLVGLVDTSPARAPWRRFEISDPPFFLERKRCAVFGTLWQSLYAPVNECRLLAAVQSVNL